MFLLQSLKHKTHMKYKLQRVFIALAASLSDPKVVFEYLSIIYYDQLL